MSKPLKIAVAGLGRMGVIHALHVIELQRETGCCQLTALVDSDTARAKNWAAENQVSAPVLASVEELAVAEVAEATVIVTPTNGHRDHATTLIKAGHRVLLEKPLTGTLEGDAEFCGELDRHHPTALMLAFQRRFDGPLAYAKDLMTSGTIGRVFKIYTSLEDSNPAPNGYASGGILPDMSVHNVDEILWLTGKMPTKAMSIGSRLYSHKLTTSDEDFDDAMLLLWFADGMMAQVQVSRNHVSGYRVETILFGEKGQIQIGHFDQKPFEIAVAAYGPRGTAQPLAKRSFDMRDYGKPLPEFIDRFGPAYKAELATFIDCCNSGSAFPATHNDGLRAQKVISAGMKSIILPEQAAVVG